MRTLACLAAIAAIGCGSGKETRGGAEAKPVAAKPPAKTAAAAPAKKKAKLPPGDAVAYFAGGCFWGVEYFLEAMDGVSNVESGYMGGHIDSPTYKQVSSSTSGHLESVRVTYHSDKVTFAALAKRFFEIHDPTQADGQGPDLGPEYMSAVFYNDEEELKITKDLISRLEKRGYNVVTKLRPATKFWLAEGYHQDYYVNKGGTPYCHAPVDRFGDM